MDPFNRIIIDRTRERKLGRRPQIDMNTIMEMDKERQLQILKLREERWAREFEKKVNSF